MVTIVNKRTHQVTKNDVYIGRGSCLGNPFSHLQGTKAEFVVASRQQAIAMYKVWLQKKIESGDVNVLLALDKIKRLSEAGAVNLVCYCKPQACHGDIIKELVDKF